MGRVTLQTIADQVGVSRMTVSNAFSRPGQLSAQLRDQILGVAEELGYVGPDPTARALASGTTGAVGLVLSDTLSYALTDEVATTFLAGIAEELTPTGLALTLLPGEGGEGGMPARDIAMDGALVYSCNPDSTAASWLIRRRIPLVLVDQEPMPGVPSINISDRLGAKAAAQHIVDLGHRRVALVSIGFVGKDGILDGVLDDVPATSTPYSQRERLEGWLEPLTAAGIEPVIVRQLIGNQDDAGYAAAELLLARSDRPTAILCFSDAIARGVVRAIQDAGLSVPADVSVVGFDDNPIAHRSQPPLTTVRQDANAKGRAAVAALMTAIEKAKTQPASRGRHLVLPTELVVRESTARPPKTQRRTKVPPRSNAPSR